MGLFSKKTSPMARASGPSIDPADWIGRKFRSSVPPNASVATFHEVIQSCYSGSGDLENAEWAVPPHAGTFVGSQGDVAAVPPAKVVKIRVATGRYVFLALWDGKVTYGDGQGGPPYEMWFVYPDFDTSVPTPVAGTWKMRDGSLTSIGWVERPRWGVLT